MSMEVAVLRFSEDGTHGEMDIVLQQTTLSLVESHQQGSMTRAVETLLQCAQKNGSVWDVNKVSILRYRASSTAPTIVYQGGSPQYSNATFLSCAHKDKGVRFDYVMYLSEHQSAAVEFLKIHGHLKVSRMGLANEDDKKGKKPVDPAARRCDQCTSNSKKKSFCLYTHQAPLLKDSFEKVRGQNDVKECQEVLERARSLIRIMKSSPPASELQERRFQETSKIVAVLERTTLSRTGMSQSVCVPDSSQTTAAPAKPNPIFKVGDHVEVRVQGKNRKMEWWNAVVTEDETAGRYKGDPTFFGTQFLFEDGSIDPNETPSLWLWNDDDVRFPVDKDTVAGKRKTVEQSMSHSPPTQRKKRPSNLQRTQEMNQDKSTTLDEKTYKQWRDPNSVKDILRQPTRLPRDREEVCVCVCVCVCV